MSDFGGNIYKFTPSGVRSTFASGVSGFLAFGPPAEATAARAAELDFNSDGHPDYVLQNTSTHQTAIWYLNNNVYVGSRVWPNSYGRLER